jgi:adenylosuccinate synthase
LNFANNALRIVVLSGPIGAGKSALAERLVERYGAHVIKTRDLIRTQLPNVKEERAALQRGGEKLDRVDGGSWVKNALMRFIEDKIGGPVAASSSSIQREFLAK